MSETGLTTIQLKKINKSKVYHYIYQQHTTSKLQIVQELQMGLSTVSQNLTLLEQEGYIQLDRRKGAVISLDVNKIEAVEKMRAQLRILLARGLCKDISRVEVHEMVDEIYDEMIGG